MESTRTAVPNLPGTRDWFHGTQFFPWMGEWGWFWDDPSVLRLLCTAFLLLHQLHHSASGIRSQRLGTCALGSLEKLDLRYSHNGQVKVYLVEDSWSRAEPRKQVLWWRIEGNRYMEPGKGWPAVILFDV